jgi:hypothetical protein
MPHATQARRRCQPSLGGAVFRCCRTHRGAGTRRARCRTGVRGTETRRARCRTGARGAETRRAGSRTSARGARSSPGFVRRVLAWRAAIRDIPEPCLSREHLSELARYTAARGENESEVRETRPRQPNTDPILRRRVRARRAPILDPARRARVWRAGISGVHDPCSWGEDASELLSDPPLPRARRVRAFVRPAFASRRRVRAFVRPAFASRRRVRDFVRRAFVSRRDVRAFVRPAFAPRETRPSFCQTRLRQTSTCPTPARSFERRRQPCGGVARAHHSLGGIFHHRVQHAHERRLLALGANQRHQRGLAHGHGLIVQERAQA